MKRRSWLVAALVAWCAACQGPAPHLAEASQGAASPAPPDTAPWHELFDGHSLTGFVPTEFGGEGEVTVRDGALQLGIGSPLTGVTWTGTLPAEPYELEVVATRVAGGDFFCGLTFPVGADHLTLVLGGWGGTVCGLSNLDGMDAAHNPTRTLRAFPTGQPVAVRVEVTADAVRALVDGQCLCQTTRRGTTLGLRAEMLPSRPLGIASFATAAAIGTLRWRPLTSP